MQQNETAPQQEPHDEALMSISRAVFVISSAAPIQINVDSDRPKDERSYVNMPTADFDKADRFVRMPQNRDDTEVSTARWYTADANKASGGTPPDPPAWLHRMVQRAPQSLGSQQLDDILYAIFSRSVSILGARPADQLITVFLQEFDDVQLLEPQGTHAIGECRLQVFAVLKAVRPTQRDFFYIRFSPVVAMTAILRPKEPWAFDASADERMLLLDAYKALGTARVTTRGKTYRGITDLLQSSVATYFFRDYHYLSDAEIAELKKAADSKTSLAAKFERGEVRTLDDANFGVVTKWGVRTFIGSIFQCPVTVIRSLVCPKASPPSGEHQVANGSFYVLFQELLAPGHAFDGKNYCELLNAQLQQKSIVDFAKECLPENAYLLLSPHSIGLLAPGRRLQMVYEDETNPLNSDPEKRFRDAYAWNILLLSLTAMQEGLLALYHRRLGDEAISEADLKDVAQEAIEDFSDYFDVSFFKSYASAFFRDAYERMQRVNSLDHQYAMLRERLSLALGKNSFQMATVLEGQATNTLETAQATKAVAVAANETARRTEESVGGIKAAVKELRFALWAAIITLIVSIVASAFASIMSLRADGQMSDIDKVTTTIQQELSSVYGTLTVKSKATTWNTRPKR
jgi:hypothetical protein